MISELKDIRQSQDEQIKEVHVEIIVLHTKLGRMELVSDPAKERVPSTFTSLMASVAGRDDSARNVERLDSMKSGTDALVPPPSSQV